MLPYALRTDAAVDRSLERMPDRVAAACVEFITGPLLRDPWRRGKPLSGELAGRRCARLDAFRIVYVIDEGTHVVHVTRIEHRADAYRPR